MNRTTIRITTLSFLALYFCSTLGTKRVSFDDAKNMTRYVSRYIIDRYARIEQLRNLSPGQAIYLPFREFQEWAQKRRDNNLPITLQLPANQSKNNTLTISQYAMTPIVLVCAIFYYFLLYNNIEQAIQN